MVSKLRTPIAKPGVATLQKSGDICAAAVKA